MNQQQKEQWLAALRSGKYEQTTGALTLADGLGDDRYCCLGVAREVCELPVTGNGFLIEANAKEYSAAAFVFLPANIQHELARMNDAGASFAVIADYIEQHVAPTE